MTWWEWLLRVTTAQAEADRQAESFSFVPSVVAVLAVVWWWSKREGS